MSVVASCVFLKQIRQKIRSCTAYKSVCFCPDGKMSDRWLERKTNIKSVQLGKRTSETPHMSTEGFGADTQKESSVFEWNRSLQRDSNTQKTITESTNDNSKDR